MQVILCYMIRQATYMNNWRWWNLMIKVSVVLQNSQNQKWFLTDSVKIKLLSVDIFTYGYSLKVS